MGIDLLSHLGRQVLEEAQYFLKTDKERWRRRYATHHVNDDVWYILLRALARSNVAASDKLPVLAECALRGSQSIREAATHALGDVGGEEGRQLLQELAANDSDTLVRQSAQEELDDLES
jgi:HEAT repeat protein